MLTDVELQEWNNAVKEYFTMQKQDEVSQSSISILEELERCSYIIGMIVNQCGIIESLEEEKYNTQKDFILYCLTKTLKTLKAIISQLLNRLPEGSLNLLRSIYENYLNIIFIIHKPEKIEDLVVAKIGLLKGTHDYVRNSKGQINKRIIYNKQTGQEYEGHISNYVMAKSSDYELDIKIFDVLYEYLSRFTHPNILSIDHYLSDNKFDPFKEDVHIEDIAVLCVFLICFILDETLNLELANEASGDIVTFLQRIKSKLTSYVRFEDGNETLFELFIQKSHKILERYSGNK